jgi:outer membrane immunogenic protein
MRKVFACGAALALLSSAGARADGYFDPAPWQTPGPGPSFAGLEFGGTLGAAVGGSGDVSLTGASGGAYIGYLLQNGPIVGGVEADTQLGSISGSGRGGDMSQNFLTSARVRGGWAFGNALAYGTIGPAWGSSTFQRNGFSFDKSLQGYTFGFGGEVALTRSISVRAELRHYDFGAATYYMTSGAQKISSGNNMLLVGGGLHF